MARILKNAETMGREMCPSIKERFLKIQLCIKATFGELNLPVLDNIEGRFARHPPASAACDWPGRCRALNPPASRLHLLRAVVINRDLDVSPFVVRALARSPGCWMLNVSSRRIIEGNGLKPGLQTPAGVQVLQ